MLSFIRWLAINGLILAFFLIGALTNSGIIYVAFTLIAISAIFAAIILLLPSAIMSFLPTFDFFGKRVLDLFYDLVFMAALIYFGYYIWAVIYSLILFASQYVFSIQAENKV